MMKCPLRLCLLLLAACFGLAASVQAGAPAVIFSNIQSSATSDVPGMPGRKFSTVQGAFDRPLGSPNGQRWIIHALASGRFLIAGGGTTGQNAYVAVQRGTSTFFDSELFYDFLRVEAAIGDDGSFAFAADTTAPTSSDEIVARWTPAAGFQLMAREGVQAAGEPPGIGYGTEAGEVQILNDGRTAFGMGGLTGSGGGSALFVNAAIDDGFALVRSGITVPQEQIAGGQFPVFFTGAFRIDATGDNYLYDAALSGGGDVIAYNNVVVAQRDRPLPGGYPGFYEQPEIFFDDGLSLSPYNGHYAFRCPVDFLDGDWHHVVIVDGEVAAATDTPIVPGSTDIWRAGDNSNSPFFLNVVNSRGDYVIGGLAWTGSSQHGVLTFNGTVELLRSGDLADLNGDGLPDSGYRIGPHTDAAFLTDDGRLFFTATFENSSGQRIGEAFLWMRVPAPGDPNCDGRIDFFDIDPFLLALFDENAYAAAWPDCWRITADLNRDGHVDFFDIDPFVECLFGACP